MNKQEHDEMLLDADDSTTTIDELISQNNTDTDFDRRVGILEELLVDEEFQDLMSSFCDKYCQEFEDEEDTNKLSYTTIFHEYVCNEYIRSTYICLILECHTDTCRGTISREKTERI
jgi:hypothetical protein